MSDDSIQIEISRELLDAVYKDARQAYPYECCGWLAGPKDGSQVTMIRVCYNAQASGTHPIASQRTSETAYVIEGDDLLELNRSFDGDAPALIIYHSHPNGRAYLSETDRTVATSPWGDGPAYPVQQLVVGIDGECVVEAALFDWSDDDGGFIEIARYEGAAV